MTHFFASSLSSSLSFPLGPFSSWWIVSVRLLVPVAGVLLSRSSPSSNTLTGHCVILQDYDVVVRFVRKFFQQGAKMDKIGTKKKRYDQMNISSVAIKESPSL